MRDMTTEELLNSQWTEILPRLKLGPSAQHFAKATVTKKWTHVKFTVYPDGGVAR